MSRKKKDGYELLECGKSYVYQYVIDGCVRYVGKGINGRDRDHLRVAININERRAAGGRVHTSRWNDYLAKALREGKQIEVVRVAEGLTEKVALAQEINMIMFYGRASVDGGVLYNDTAGGDGMTSEDMKEMWADSEYRKHQSAAQRAAHARPEVKACQSATSKRMWARPEMKARLSAAIKAAHARPEVKACRSVAMKAAYARPEVKARMSTTQKIAWAVPGVKAQRLAILKAARARPEVKARLSAALKIE